MCNAWQFHQNGSCWLLNYFGEVAVHLLKERKEKQVVGLFGTVRRGGKDSISLF